VEPHTTTRRRDILTEDTKTENSDINWDDPEERAKLIEKFSVKDYIKGFNKHIEKSTVAIVAGHSIRPVVTRFGKLWQVGNTGKAFKTLEEAETYASDNPTEENERSINNE
jgi:hypothetical protein